MSLRLLERRARGGDAEELEELDPRMQARRDAVDGARRARWRRALWIAVVVTVLAGAAWGVTQSPVMDVDEVRVEGTSRLSAGEVLDTAGIVPGDRLVDLDLDAARARLEQLAWVREATVERSWSSGDVTLRVVERTPAAAIASDGGWLLVDTDRHVLAVTPTAPADLVVVEGVAPAGVAGVLDPSAAGALQVAAALTPGLRSRVGAVRLGADGAVELALRPSGSVRFGPATDVGEKVRSLQTVFGQVDLRCLTIVDVRVPDAPVLTRDRACL